MRKHIRHKLSVRLAVWLSLVTVAVLACTTPAAMAQYAQTTAMPTFGAAATDVVQTATPVSEPTAQQVEDPSQERTATQLAQDEAALTAVITDTTLGFEGKLAQVFAKYQTLGAVVCLVENGTVSHVYTYGDRDAVGTPITADTMFQVGSISKMVTAMGVMRLVQDGKASLDQDLTELLGTTVRNASYPDTPITLRQLMTHTAGLRDSSLYADALLGDALPLSQLFAPKLNKYAFTDGMQPGVKAKYSNFGGGLLGSILEQVSGESVDDYMSRVLFTPLGIQAAYLGWKIPADAAVSDLYRMPQKRLVKTVRETATDTVTDAQLDYTLTAGKLTISAPDLAKLVIALCDGGLYGDVRVLDESAVLQMRTMQNGIGSVSGDSQRGLCINLITDTLVPGRTLYGHGGKANGMLCAAYFDPTDRTGIVMLTNGCNNRQVYRDVGMLSIQVIRLCYSQLIQQQHSTQDPWLVTE